MKFSRDVMICATLGLVPSVASFTTCLTRTAITRTCRPSASATTFLKVASLPKITDPAIDNALSSITPTSESSPKKLRHYHKLLDDGAGHINSELAESIWQWENSHIPVRTTKNHQDEYPAKRLQYSTRDGLRLVDNIAQTMLGDEYEHEYESGTGRYPDLVQEGVVALMRCTVLWDEQNANMNAATQAHAAFEAFARKNIEEAMKSSLKDSTVVEIDLESLKKRRKEIERINEQDQSKKSSMSSDSVDSPPSALNQMVQPLRRALEDENPPTPEEIALSDMIRHDITEFLERQLTDEELRIVRLRFGLEDGVGGRTAFMSTEEIASTMGLDVGIVQKLEDDALNKLRTSFEDDYIGAYLDDDPATEVSL